MKDYLITFTSYPQHGELKLSVKSDDCGMVATMSRIFVHNIPYETKHNEVTDEFVQVEWTYEINEEE